MHFVPNPEFGNRMITLMAALVLVLQIAMVGQRWIVYEHSDLCRAVVSAWGHRRRIAYFNHAATFTSPPF